jgi:hypothetical protein
MDEISSGEILRRFDAIDKKLDDMPSAIASEFVRRELFETQHQHLAARVAKLEDSSQWIVRLVLGLVVTAIVASAVVIG